MEDINAIKTYIQNNCPNITIIGNDACLVITNDAKNCGTYKKLEDKLQFLEISDYLTEFNLKSRKVFMDMSKFDKFPEYKEILKQLLEYYPAFKQFSEIIVTEWIWKHDEKDEILIDIESYNDNGLYGAIFKDQEIMYINKDNDLCHHNNIDEDLIKRTKSFRHIKFFECSGDGNYDNSYNYYDKEEHTHQHCFDIIDHSYSNTEYYKKEEDIKPKEHHYYDNYLTPESPEKQEFLNVVIYDKDNEIYKEINYGFLVKEIDDFVCCYKKVVNDQEIELSEIDKKICAPLGITYRKF